MKERILRPNLPPGRDEHGRRPVPTAALDEMDQAAVDAAQEVLPTLQEMIRERLRHVAENIPVGDTQELILTTHAHPPFFSVTTRRVP